MIQKLTLVRYLLSINLTLTLNSEALRSSVTWMQAPSNECRQMPNPKGEFRTLVITSSLLSGDLL